MNSEQRFLKGENCKQRNTFAGICELRYSDANTELSTSGQVSFRRHIGNGSHGSLMFCSIKSYFNPLYLQF